MMQTEPMQSMASATASNAEVFDAICIDIDIDMKVLRNNNRPKTSNPDNTRSAMPMPGDRKTRTHTECYTEATNSTGASESWRRVLSRSNSGRSTGSSSTAFSSNSKSVSSTKSSCSKSPSKKGKKDAKSCLKASKDKPKRPLSAYNIFFKHTRTRIIQGLDDEGTTAEEVTIASIEAIVANSTKPRVRRSNRKTHGQIGFGDLARTIAQKWKAIDKDRRAIYERYAALDMKRYRRDISVWKARKETEALAEAIAESSCNGNTSNDDEGSKRAFSPTTSDDEFKTPQHRALNTTSANSSFSSIDSEGSLSIDDESRETKNSTFPTHSVPTEKTAIDNNNNNNNNNEMLRKSQELEVLIHELKREVSALKFNNDSNRKKIHNYNNANNSNYHQQHDSPGNFQQLMPPYPVGPSIERMQELHRRRMLRGDFLPPFGNHPRENPYAPSHGTTSNSMVHRKFFDDAPTVDTDLEGIDVDPIPFEEVFHPSGVGEFDIF